MTSSSFWSLSPLVKLFSIFCLALLFSPHLSYAQTPEINISSEGVISSYSVPCTGTNATALLIYPIYPHSNSVREYMRRPCTSGIVTFDSFDLRTHLLNLTGSNELLLYYYHFPQRIVVKDTTTLFAPNYTAVINLVNSQNNYNNSVLDPNNNTFPTLFLGPKFNYDGVTWSEVLPPPPPETIGDPNNLSAQISSSGDVPRISISCTANHSYTLSLVNSTEDVARNSIGVLQARPCENGAATFNGFNINNLLNSGYGSTWWSYVHTPLEYIIKDTTSLYPCDEFDCPTINLAGSHNNYDYSVYLASSTYYTTVGKGPIYDTTDHTTWFNLGPSATTTGTTTPTCTVDCNSNVMFFPGLMGSRLYENPSGTTGGEEELWVSSMLSDSKQARLALGQDGKSLNEIYTKDDIESLADEAETGIIDETFRANIYNSFITNLREWKQDERIIEDYAFIPYDWRLSLEDIVTNASTTGSTTSSDKLAFTANQNFSESYILRKLSELQKSSRTGKVTLIGHSNGGLVIKALVQKLKDTNNPLYIQIDKIILVAVPQIGTPEAVLDLLHGTSLGWGAIMKNQRSRLLAENMPTVYNLLPSSSYFTTVDPGFAFDKVVSFENSPAYGTQISEYGLFVSNPLELKNYVLGSDGRVKPGYSDTDKPSIGNSELYSVAELVHSILDLWQPASTTKVIQVAGWGEETLAGVHYKKCLDKSIEGYHKCFEPKMVVDGDGTVVVSSALWMSTSTPNVERWWVDLKKYNEDSAPDRIHRSILEVENLNDFIKSTISLTSFSDPEQIILNNTSALTTNKTRLHYTLHSPLTLGVTDSLGRYTGLDPLTHELREEIPNVNYRVIGGTQFISVPSDLVGQVKLQGLDTGVFALDIEKQQGNTVLEKTSFQGIDSGTTTIATLNIDNSVASSTLVIDSNGDGATDLSLKAKIGEVVTPPKYKWSGFLQPINDLAFYPNDKQSVFKGGSTVPVKFQLRNAYGVIVQASSSPVWLSPQKGSAMNAPVDESTYTDSGSVGSDFKYDTVSQEYHYNWKTKGYATGYWYKLSVKLDDGNVYSVVVGLR